MTPAGRRELRRVLLFLAAVGVLVFVARVYRDVEDGAFVWDDHVLVEADSAYRHDSFAQVMTESFWPESPLSDVRALPYYRPAVLLSYRFDIALGGLPADFHVTNLLLHLAACAFLGIIAVRAGAAYPSAIGAMLLWGVMPRLTEAVVWIAGRTDVLATFFGLAALAVWPEMGVVKSGRPWLRATLGAFLLFAALLSKEVAFSFVVVIVLASWLQKADQKRALATIGVPVLAYLALRTIALAGRNGSHRPLGAMTRAGTVLEASERYLEMTFDALRPRTSIGLLGEVDGTRAAIGGVVILLAIGAAVLVARRGSFGVRVGLTLTACAIAPVLHVVPFAIAGGVTADRLLYAPFAGLAIAGACALKPKLAFLVPALAVVLGAATARRVDDYTEETRFWTTAAETAHPQNTMPRLALAGWLSKAGEIPTACRLYERAVRTNAPAAQHGRAREGLANCWARIGRYDDALKMAQSVVADEPTNARAELAVGFALLHLRRFDEATAAFDEATLRDPALRPYRPSDEALAKMREDDVVYSDLRSRFDDPSGWANHLAAIGRGPEASEAFTAIVNDVDADPDAREEATRYFLLQGSAAEAAHALSFVPPPHFGWDTNLRNLFKRRYRTYVAVTKLASRIDALTR